MTTKEKIEVMQAFEDGKEIQYTGGSWTGWVDTETPVWDWPNCDYRIKPKLFKQKFEVEVWNAKNLCINLPMFELGRVPKEGTYKVIIEEVTE